VGPYCIALHTGVLGLPARYHGRFEEWLLQSVMCANLLRGSFTPPVCIMISVQLVISIFYTTFLTDAGNLSFSDINDHAMLIIEIMLKRGNEYFTHLAFSMPE
jgi:hypothetical protein